MFRGAATTDTGCLGADTRRVVIMVLALCLAGIIQFTSDSMTRHVVIVGGLQSKTSTTVFGDGSLTSLFSHREEDSDAAKTVAGVVEFDYIDYHLRQITYFFTVLFMQPLAARIAKDEGNGRHQAVGQRLSAALTFTAKAATGTLLLVVGGQLMLRLDMVSARIPSAFTKSGTHDDFQSLKFCGDRNTKASLLCIWHHTVLRFLALPLHIVAKCAAIPCFLGVHRVDLVLFVSVAQAISKLFLTWLFVMQFQLRLTGAGAADILSAGITIGVLVYAMSLESIRAKYHVNWDPKSMLCWHSCGSGGGGRSSSSSNNSNSNSNSANNNDDTAVNDVSFQQDVKTTLPRALVFVAIRITAASLFDAGNPYSSWSLNTAFGALQQLEELPSVVGDSLSLVITVVACKYLNHIYMIYNPHDFEELVHRFPYITALLTLLFAGTSVYLAPYALGSTLAGSTGIGHWWGVLCYVLAQVVSSAALMFEGLLFANVEFQTVTRMTLLSFVPTSVCFLVVWVTSAKTPVLWLALMVGSGTRLYLTHRHVYRTTLGDIHEDGTTIDEFDALLNDDDEDDDEGPVDLEAAGLTSGRGNTGGGSRKMGGGGGAGAAGRKSRRNSTRRPKKEKHSRQYKNYQDYEKDDEEFQEAFRGESSGSLGL